MEVKWEAARAALEGEVLALEPADEALVPVCSGLLRALVAVGRPVTGREIVTHLTHKRWAQKLVWRALFYLRGPWKAPPRWLEHKSEGATSWLECQFWPSDAGKALVSGA